MRLLLAGLLLVGASQAKDRRDEPWSDEYYAKAAIRADRELQKIMTRIERGDIPKVQFDFDKSDIRPESYTALNMIADVLLKNPTVKLKIIAHTCSMGTAEYNLKLSERRAKSVMDFLVERGVPPPTLRFRGAGFAEPIADNSTEEGREKNRRVEFRIVTRDWGSVY